jgi:hypothetical protein
MTEKKHKTKTEYCMERNTVPYIVILCLIGLCVYLWCKSNTVDVKHSRPRTMGEMSQGIGGAERND